MGREEVRKSPMSVYPRRGFRRPPCLGMWRRSWEGPHDCVNRERVGKAPHIYVYKEGIEKALMFVSAERG